MVYVPGTLSLVIIIIIPIINNYSSFKRFFVNAMPGSYANLYQEMPDMEI